MEAAMNLVSSSPPFHPPRTAHFKHSPCSSTYLSGIGSTVSFYVLMARERTSAAYSSMPVLTYQHLPSSPQSEEQHNNSMPSLHILDEEKGLMNKDAVLSNETDKNSSDALLRDFQHQLLRLPGLSSLLRLSPIEEKPFIIEKLENLSFSDAMSPSVDALSAAKEALSLAENSKLVGADCDESFSSSVTSFLEERIVRSTRHVERQAKKRKVMIPENKIQESAEPQHELRKHIGSNDPLDFFLRPHESKKLLTKQEEVALISEIHGMNKLKEVKRKLYTDLGREPTIAEWANAVGRSCGQLRSQLLSADRSREKLVMANLRLVVHVVKRYRGSGLSFNALLQAGSLGLVVSVDKYKLPSAARFSSYAYWWIRHSATLAIHKYSKPIRIPVSQYKLRRKVAQAKRSFIQEGNHHPTDEQLAERVGTTVEKLRYMQILFLPHLSLDKRVLSEDGATYQEVTEDTQIESPDKVYMRKHVHGLLNSLDQRERLILKLRYGIGYERRRTLREVGDLLHLSAKRIQVIELRATEKLKQSMDTHGLDAYKELFV
ncbi:hypothetical protein Droror1_Dr00026205 [Drosera rotundifolia]